MPYYHNYRIMSAVKFCASTLLKYLWLELLLAPLDNSQFASEEATPRDNNMLK